jgi:hypothetical protein
MVLSHQRQRTVRTGTDQIAKGLCIALQLLDVRVVGQAVSWNGSLLSSRPGVRTVGQEGDGSTFDHHTRWASPFPRTGGAPGSPSATLVATPRVAVRRVYILVAKMCAW